MRNCIGESGMRYKHLRCAQMCCSLDACIKFGGCGFPLHLAIPGTDLPHICTSVPHTRVLADCVCSQSLGIATLIQLSIKTKQSTVLCHSPSCRTLWALIWGERRTCLKPCTVDLSRSPDLTIHILGGTLGNFTLSKYSPVNPGHSE